MKSFFTFLLFIAFFSSSVLGLSITEAFYKDRQAYNSGDTIACGALGIRYYKGTVVKQDYIKASKLFKQACEGGNNKGCKKFKI